MKKQDLELARKLHRLRMHVGLNQTELAQLLALHRSAVSSWESGKKYAPSGDSLALLAGVAEPGEVFWFLQKAGLNRRQVLRAAMHWLLVEKELPLILAPSADRALLREVIEELGVIDAEGGKLVAGSILLGQMPAFLAVTRAADILRVKKVEVLRLIKSGELKALKLTPKGAYLVDYAALLKCRDAKLAAVKQRRKRGK